MTEQPDPTTQPGPAPRRADRPADHREAEPHPGPTPDRTAAQKLSPPQLGVQPPAEEVLWVGRTSWKHFAGSIAVWALAAVLLSGLFGWLAAQRPALGGSVAFWIVLVVILSMGAWTGTKIIRGVFGHRYRLTNERLFIEHGIFSRTIDQTELIRVDDVRIHKSFLNMIFGLGTVEVLSTDLSDGKLRIEGIQQSEQVAEAIRNSMRSLRKGSLFVEAL